MLPPVVLFSQHKLPGNDHNRPHNDSIPDFPTKLKNELKHCILAHHGELEYGSPKKPALIEAMALNLADNADAKIETMTELLNSNSSASSDQWLGYNRLLETNVRKTSELK